jgi:hypothetical protein
MSQALRNGKGPPKEPLPLALSLIAAIGDHVFGAHVEIAARRAARASKISSQALSQRRWVAREVWTPLSLTILEKQVEEMRELLASIRG